MINEELINKSGVRREQHLPRERADKGGQHKGHEEHALHEGLVRQIRTRDKPCEECADNRAPDRRAGRDDQRVEQCLECLRFLEDIDHTRKIKLTVHPECIEENEQNRECDDDDKNGNRKE